MRLRPFLFAVVIVSGFIYATSVARWDVRRLLHPLTATGKLSINEIATYVPGGSRDD